MGVYCKSGKWYIDYYCEGRRIRECVGTSKVRAAQALAVRKAQVVEGRYNIKRKNTPLLGELAEKWIEEKQVRLKHSTLIDYKSILGNYLIPAFGRKPIGKITEAEIERFISTLKGRSPQRINNILTPLKGILKYAYTGRFINVNFGEFIKPLRVEKPDIMPLKMEEVTLFLETVDIHFKDYFSVSFFTGMRPSEQIALKWDGIDFSRNKIAIAEARVKGVEGTPKTIESKRAIDMLPPVKEALKRQAGQTFMKGPYVFLSKESVVLDINNLRNRTWYPTLKKVKLKKRTMYQARHSFATLMLSSGENPMWVARTMGHSSTEMLFKRYSQFIPNLTHRDGAAFLEKFYGHGHLLDTREGLGNCSSKDMRV